MTYSFSATNLAGQVAEKSYMGYTKREAKKRFMEYLKTLNPVTRWAIRGGLYW